MPTMDRKASSLSCNRFADCLVASGLRRRRASRNSRSSRIAAERPSCEPRWSRDHGYSLVETAIAWPVFFAVILLVVQFALLWHGRHVAEAAARDGLEAGRGLDASAASGQAAATGYLKDVAPRLLTGTRVEVTRDATTVRVQVRAQVLHVIPGWDLMVSETASGPVEKFVSLPDWPPAADIGREGTEAVMRL
jgi:Flp pilus assembly protein TadG